MMDKPTGQLVKIPITPRDCKLYDFQEGKMVTHQISQVLVRVWEEKPVFYLDPAVHEVVPGVWVFASIDPHVS